jgi:hypothetical protein
MRAALAILTLALSARALALDSMEFHLYGSTKSEVMFDVRPFGKDSWAKGGVREPDGLHGDFFRWVGSEQEGRFVPVGSCTVKEQKAFDFRCKKGNYSLSGVAYTGDPLDESKLDQIPEAKKLWRAFIKRYGYGKLGALFRCSEGCTESIPPYLILGRRGD